MPCDPGEHCVVAAQNLERKEVEYSTMLLRTKVQGVGQVIADADRHPDLGCVPVQGLGMIVLCP